MKSETPAERPKQVYLKFSIHSEKNIELSEAVDAFWDAATQYLGVKDLSDAEPWFIANKYSSENGKGVLRVNKEYEDELRAGMTLIDSFDGCKGFLSVEKTSGAVGNL